MRQRDVRRRPLGGGRGVDQRRGNGHFVAFTSSASDLVAGDSNGHDDVFVRDLAAGVTERVSTGAVFDSVNTTNGSAAISANGRVVAFVTTSFDSTGEDVFSRVFARDRRAGTTALVSADVDGNDPDGSSGQPAVSGSGRFVAFSSVATDLVASDSNGVGDVFIRAVTTPTITSVAPSTLSQGSHADLTIHGTGFQAGARALVVGSGGVTVTSTTVVSETELRAHVQVAPDAPTGGRDLLVFTPGTGPGASATGYGVCSGCITIT